VSLEEAIALARTGAKGSAFIDDWWTVVESPELGGFTNVGTGVSARAKLSTTRYSSGSVDLDWLRDRVKSAKKWSVEGAR
jgi:hypothetical protein